MSEIMFVDANRDVTQVELLAACREMLAVLKAEWMIEGELGDELCLRNSCFDSWGVIADGHTLECPIGRAQAAISRAEKG